MNISCFLVLFISKTILESLLHETKHQLAPVDLLISLIKIFWLDGLVGKWTMVSLSDKNIVNIESQGVLL